ncbi:MAG: phosphoadenosine phosphosulfate reductase family protein [Candidatus Thermoplasmatota archaeon]|nr:phosphoadenosine phosphosulfate reductase family protein [Candidatus Thermoplasmatota archaeon]
MIYLGKLALHWCHKCNLPVLGKACGICGNETFKVRLTPPGDVRPAFPFDLKLCQDVIKGQFGDAILPEMTLLNDVPSTDKMEEVIFNGKVAGALQYSVKEKKFHFLPRIWFASLISPTKGFVIADDGAVSPILNGSNLLAPGVVEASREIRTGDEVVIYSPEKELIAVGKACMDSEEMTANGHGMAVKIRWKGTADKEKIRDRTWDDALMANSKVISNKINEAVNFIHKVIKANELPIAVSFSGGKDSLATLFLLLDAGYNPPIFFINTGLEFEETIEHVHRVAKQLDLELLEENAGDIFWKAIDFFGPSARDFRWCCKTCKLGPTTRLIKKNFPDGVLSFIGQRRYESEQRSKKGSMWKNPWVSGQLGASPIQNWTALHVWLYLFEKYKEYGIKWNVLYEQGFSRIGCWLCPASDMAEFEFKRHKDWNKLIDKLEKYARDHGLSEEWIKNGLWRWLVPPKWANIEAEKEVKRDFSGDIDNERVKNFMNCIGKVKEIDGGYVVNDVEILLSEDDFKVNAPTQKKKKIVESVIDRALNCTGCGVCTGQCRQNAISIKNGKAWIDGERCIHCGECVNICPIAVFGRRGFVT